MTLAEQYPTIAWTEPQPITILGGDSGFNCRICVATFGFTATAEGPHFATVEEGRAHIAEVHPEYLP